MLTHACCYEMIEDLGEDTIVVHRGWAFALNISAEGIQILMDQAPQVQQLLEIHTPSSKRRRILTLFEVRWTRQVQLEGHDPKYLVGCRLTFGPSPHFLFKTMGVEHSEAQSLHPPKPFTVPGSA